MTNPVAFRQIGRGVARTLGPNALAAAISALTIVIMLRSTSPTEWGLVAAAVSVAQFTGGIMDMGSSTSVIRRLSEPSKLGAAKAEFDQLSIARLGVWRIILVVGTIAWIATFMGFSWWLVLLAASVFLSIGSTALLLAQAKFFTAASMTVADKATVLGIVAASLATDTLSAGTYPAALAVGATVGAAIAMTVSGVRLGLVWPLARRSSLHVWRGSVSFGIANNAPTLLLFDIAIVTALAGSYEAGLFALAARLVAPLSIAATAISKVVFPLFSHRAISTPGRDAWLKAGGGVAIVMAGLLGLLVTAGWWVPTLFGEDYVAAIWPVRLYLLNVFVVLFTRTFATILQSQGRERAVSILVTLSTVVALALIGIGASYAGALGASFGVLISNMFLVCGLVCYTVKSSVLKPRVR